MGVVITFSRFRRQRSSKSSPPPVQHSPTWPPLYSHFPPYPPYPPNPLQPDLSTPKRRSTRRRPRLSPMSCLPCIVVNMQDQPPVPDSSKPDLPPPPVPQPQIPSYHPPLSMPPPPAPQLPTLYSHHSFPSPYIPHQPVPSSPTMPLPMQNSLPCVCPRYPYTPVMPHLLQSTPQTQIQQEPPLLRPGFEHVDAFKNTTSHPTSPSIPLYTSASTTNTLPSPPNRTPSPSRCNCSRSRTVPKSSNRRRKPSSFRPSPRAPPRSASPSTPPVIPNNQLPSPLIQPAISSAEQPSTEQPPADPHRSLAPAPLLSVPLPASVPSSSVGSAAEVQQSAPSNTNALLRSQFVRQSQDAAYRAVTTRSVQLHDFNTNMMVLVTLGDQPQPLNTSPSGRRSNVSVSDRSSTSSSDANSASGVSGTASLQDEDQADDQVHSSSDGSETNEMDHSEVTDEGNSSIMLKRLTEGSPEEIIKRALQRSSAEGLSEDSHRVVMQALERGLTAAEKSAGSEGCNVDPALRAEVHYNLAKFSASKAPIVREKVQKHCRAGLQLLYGREKLRPLIVAELNLLSAQMLLSTRDPHSTSAIISHARSARVALSAEYDAELLYQVCLALGDAYAISPDEPVCDNIAKAYDAYTEATEMLRIIPLEKGTEWMRLGCLCSQLILRFLRHKRIAANSPNCVCSRTETSACRKDPKQCDAVKDLTIEKVMEITEKLKHNVDDYEHRPSGKNLISIVYECVGRAYMERSIICSGSYVFDLQKAQTSLTKALNCCSWSTEYAGQRYTVIRELLDDVEAQIAEANQANPDDRPPKSVDNESEQSTSESGKEE